MQPETNTMKTMAVSDANIWGLNKDPSIKSILLLLVHEVGGGRFVMLDQQNLHHKAVRLTSPANQNELSVYIYCYAQQPGRYGVDLEFPHRIETDSDDQTIRLNDLSAEQTIEEIVDHLELSV